MALIPSYPEILNRRLTDAESRQFMADQEHERQREWIAKYQPEQNPMELFGNCR